MDTIGARIKAARKRAQLSQEALARRAGMSTNGVARIEQGGITDPHYSTLRKLAAVLGVSPHWLYTGEELEEPVLAGKGEAPKAGRPDKSETIIDTVRDLVIKQDRRETQALNRLEESRQPQWSFGHDDHKAMMYLLGLPKGAVEDAFIDLTRSRVELERENARLEQENAQLKEERTRARVDG